MAEVSPNPAPRANDRPPLLRWLFSWRTLRRVLLALAALLTAMVAYLTWERVRGRQAWERYKSDAQAEGRWHELSSFAQPAVPDGRNFAAMPLLASLAADQGAAVAGEIAERIDTLAGGRPPNPKSQFVAWDLAQPVNLQAWREFWNTPDLRKTLRQFPELDEIAAASRRPNAQFFPWDERVFKKNFPTQLTLLRLGRLLELRALAELAAGQADPAGEDALALLRVTRHLTATPTLGFQLTALVTEGVAMQVLWEGLAAHRWTDAQLQAFQVELTQLDFLASTFQAMQVEEALVTAALEQAATGRADRFGDALALIGAPDLARQFPAGWIYQNLLRYRRLFDDSILSAYDLPRRRLDPAGARAAEETAREFATSRSPYALLLNQIFPALNYLLRQFSAGQARRDAALIACALERFRLAKGKYPETLAELSPQFLEKPPADVNTGEAMKYRREGDDGFVLYSIGADGMDNGGAVFAKQGPFADIGDWVWSYSPKDVVK